MTKKTLDPSPAAFEQRASDTADATAQLGINKLSTVFNDAIGCLEVLGDTFSEEQKKLSELRTRLQEGRFHLAILGQFKRGKSTLLNALVGDKLLPSSVLPLTAIPTFIQAGDSLRAEALNMNGVVSDKITGDSITELSSFLSKLVTEEANPENRLGISHVNVFHPSPLLKNGVVLIDTPGIGSIFIHNTEVTLNFLPQCDAALFLISADPPISEVELEFLHRVKTLVPRLFFILNKVDYLSESEKRDATLFYKKILKEKVGFDDDVPIFAVSALQGLQAHEAEDERRWSTSGMAAVEDHLVHFLAKEKAEVLRRALSSKATDVLSDILLQINLTIRSLNMPLEELEQRQHVFEGKIRETEQQKMVAGDLLTGDRKRLMEFLEDQAADLRQKGRIHFEHILEQILADNVSVDEARQTLLNELPVFFERELGDMSRIFEARVTEILQPHQARADELIETIRKTAAELFEIPYRAPESSQVFEMTRQPYWATQQRQSFMNPIPEGVIYNLLPAGMRKKRMRKYLSEEIGFLVFQNVENLRWVTLQNLNQGFRRFSLELADRLEDTIVATHGAIQEAIKKRTEQLHTVVDALQRYETVKAALEQMMETIRGN
jgi:GTP-binding protein EngB required for normal cell division